MSNACKNRQNLTLNQSKRNKDKEKLLFVNELICCRPKELRKRASILLGIKQRDPIYAELEKYLKEIRKHRDLVSDFSICINIQQFKQYLMKLLI